VVAGVSLMVGAFGAMKLSLPAIDAWSEGKEIFFGCAVVLVIAGSFLLSIRLSRGRGAAVAQLSG